MRICPECHLRTLERQCPRDGYQTVDEVRLATPGRDPRIGTVFENRYRVDAVLAEGGMGVVYRATQLAAQRPVALKVIRREELRAGDLARFQKEARAIAALNHPNTVRFQDFGETSDGRFYLVMEYLEGRPLSAAIRADGPFAPARALAIAKAALQALAEAHAQGVVHRDLKPQNLFLARIHGQPEFVKVLDFGLAKLTGDADDGLTPAGHAVGSPRYMSPEQVAGMPVTPAADVYSMGIILYEMLTGAHPFRCETSSAYMIAHATLPPIPLEEHVPSLTGALPALVLACLAKSIEARPRDADALLGRIEALERSPLAAGRHQSEPAATTLEVPSTSATLVPTPFASLAAQQRGTATRSALGELELTPRTDPDAYALDSREELAIQTTAQALPSIPRRTPLEAVARRAPRQGSYLLAGLGVGVAGALALAWWLVHPPAPSLGAATPDVHLPEPPATPAGPVCGRLEVPCPPGFFCTEGGRCAKEDLVLVPAGPFSRGCPPGGAGGCQEDAPAGEATLPAFGIDVHEVTVDGYAECVEAGACGAPPELSSGDCNHTIAGRGDHPANCASWPQARRYCEWRKKRLCSETEWEKAARGRDARPYPWGIEAPTCERVVSRLVRLGCGTGTTEPVASRAQGLSPYGVYDLVGNVEEWVSDGYREDAYRAQPQATDGAGALARVVRGGSYREPLESLTAYHRRKRPPDTVSPSVGFRCCQTVGGL